jgi:hypothetical protein
MFAALALVMLTPLPDLGRDPPPPLSDLGRFPDAKAADARCRALQRQCCMVHQQQDSPERDYALRQIEYATECWGALLGAHDQKASERDRRESLMELNHLLGDRDYRRGQMP